MADFISDDINTDDIKVKRFIFVSPDFFEFRYYMLGVVKLNTIEKVLILLEKHKEILYNTTDSILGGIYG